VIARLRARPTTPGARPSATQADRFAGGFYDVRWFRAHDRGKLIGITRERFQLQNHSIGRRTGSVSRSNPRLAPKALPISEDEIKPRRLAPEAVG
jgi:hypothetical protein